MAKDKTTDQATKDSAPEQPDTSGTSGGASGGGGTSGAKRPYVLTEDWAKENGAVLPKGTRLDLTADEVSRRNIPAKHDPNLKPRA